MRIAALAGGTGAAKLLRGLAPLLPPDALTIIGNTGDDTELWGLHISPDLDTVCYTLAGLIDERKGWGLRGETFHALEQMPRFGEPGWFGLGDRDLATHLHRTRLLREGRSLTEVTADIAAALGVGARVLPMSDQPVRTHIRGPEGWISLPGVLRARQGADRSPRRRLPGRRRGRAGAGRGRGAPRRAGRDRVPVEPDHVDRARSSPCPGIRRALEETTRHRPRGEPHHRRRRGVGPGGAPHGMAAACRCPRRAWRAPTPPWLDLLVVDERDADLVPEIDALGVRAPSRRHPHDRPRDGDRARRAARSSPSA